MLYALSYSLHKTHYYYSRLITGVGDQTDGIVCLISAVQWKYDWRKKIAPLTVSVMHIALRRVWCVCFGLYALNVTFPDALSVWCVCIRAELQGVRYRNPRRIGNMTIEIAPSCKYDI